MSDNRSSGGIGVAGLLGVAFVVLKLAGVIGWSWWWVTCPFWIFPALGVAILVVFSTVALVVLVLKELVDRLGQSRHYRR